MISRHRSVSVDIRPPSPYRWFLYCLKRKEQIINSRAERERSNVYFKLQFGRQNYPLKISAAIFSAMTSTHIRVSMYPESQRKSNKITHRQYSPDGQEVAMQTTKRRRHASHGCPKHEPWNPPPPSDRLLFPFGLRILNSSVSLRVSIKGKRTGTYKCTMRASSGSWSP